MLEIGSTLDLTLEDTDGNTVAISDYRGRSSIFLYFMRALSCAQCNAHVQSLVKNRELFESAGATIIIAVPEGRDEATAWKRTKALPFAVVTGQAGSPHESVGLLRKVFGAVQQSGSILVDRNGVVRYSHVSTVPTTSFNRAEVQAALGGLAEAS